jgi:hypothetical protein
MNVTINALLNVSANIVERRFGMVLDDHPDFFAQLPPKHEGLQWKNQTMYNDHIRIKGFHHLVEFEREQQLVAFQVKKIVSDSIPANTAFILDMMKNNLFTEAGELVHYPGRKPDPF